ncbi:MAG: hypothetical protein RIC16_04670 [Rhodospirillales bacterium]
MPDCTAEAASLEHAMTMNAVRRGCLYRTLPERGFARDSSVLEIAYHGPSMGGKWEVNGRDMGSGPARRMMANRRKTTTILTKNDHL